MDEIIALRAELEKYSHAYHVIGSPLISDFEYDQLAMRLKFLEQMSPDSVTLSNKHKRYEYVDVMVVGVSSINDDGQSRQQIISDIKNKRGCFADGTVKLDINQYEHKGKSTFGIYANGLQIGYVVAGFLPFIEENFSRINGITGVDIRGGQEGKNFSVVVTLCLNRGKSKHRAFKLTGNSNEEMQNNINICSEGDEVFYDYDFDKDKYIVSDGGDIGYLPKSAEKWLDENCKIFIDRIDEDEDGKYSVTVSVTEVIP